MEGILFFFILFLAALLIFNKHIKWWVKSLIALYYGIVIYIFSNSYKKINDDYIFISKNEYNPHEPAEVEALENYWNLQTDFVDNFQGFFHFPILILLVVSYYQWIKNGKNKTQKTLISLSIIPIGLIYLWLTIMIGMLGYQP